MFITEEIKSLIYKAVSGLRRKESIEDILLHYSLQVLPVDISRKNKKKAIEDFWDAVCNADIAYNMEATKPYRLIIHPRRI
jgi:hypothetical protein